MSFTKRVVSNVIDQFRRPRGVGGWVAGWIMGHRASNRERNAWVVSELGVEPGHRVLEIGFGPGVALAEATRRATDGTVVGIDHSPLMVRVATRRNRRAVARGRIELRVGTAEDLPAFDEPFDVVYAVNSHQFWGDLPRRMRALRSLLRPGGVLGIGYQPRHPGATDDDARKAAVELSALLEEAAFVDVQVHTLPLDPMVICVTGRR
jgi:SAM-dependent methyltransferase